jgi:hypothetical protein
VRGNAGRSGAVTLASAPGVAVARSGERWTMLVSTSGGADVYTSLDGLRFEGPVPAELARRAAGEPWSGPWQGGLISLDGRLRLVGFADWRLWTSVASDQPGAGQGAGGGLVWGVPRSINARGRWPSLVLAPRAGPAGRVLLVMEGEPGESRAPGPRDPGPGPGPGVPPVPSPAPEPGPGPGPGPGPEPAPLPRDPNRQPPNWTPDPFPRPVPGQGPG